MASEVSFAESKKSSEAAAAPEAYEPDGFVAVDADEDLPFWKWGIYNDRLLDIHFKKAA